MALFFKKKVSAPANSIKSEDEILGYMDDVLSNRSILTVKYGKESAECRPYSLEDSKKLLLIENVGRVSGFNGKTVSCGFALEGFYFGFKTELNMIDGRPALKFPDFIEVSERRKEDRTALISRESPQVSVLEEFGGGIGITGELINIGAGGICLKVVRVMDIRAEKEISASRANLPKGHKLMLVRVKSFGGVHSFDASGEVVWSSYGKLGIKFTSIPSGNKKEVKRFVESRKHDKTPVKRSRQKKEEMKKLREQEASISAENLKSEAQKPAPKPKVPKPATIISLGKELGEAIAFIKKIPQYKWINCETPIELSEHLKQDHGKSILMVQHNINGKNMLGLLKKLYSMDLLHHEKILFFSSTGIQREDIAVCKLVGIKDVLELPLKNIDKVKEILP